MTIHTALPYLKKWVILQCLLLFMSHFDSLWLPVTTTDDYALSSGSINISALSLENDTDSLQWIYHERCPPQAILLDKIDSYEAMNRWVDRLHLACYVLFVIPILLYVTLYTLGMTPALYRRSCFWIGILMLSLFTCSSVCYQMATSFTCRPIEIIFDWRFTSMLGMQMFAFLVCLHHAYVFASVYLIAPIRRQAPSEVVGKSASEKSDGLALVLQSNYDLDVSK